MTFEASGRSVKLRSFWHTYDKIFIRRLADSRV